MQYHSLNLHWHLSMDLNIKEHKPWSVWLLLFLTSFLIFRIASRSSRCICPARKNEKHVVHTHCWLFINTVSYIRILIYVSNSALYLFHGDPFSIIKFCMQIILGMSISFNLTWFSLNRVRQTYSSQYEDFR